MEGMLGLGLIGFSESVIDPRQTVMHGGARGIQFRSAGKRLRRSWEIALTFQHRAEFKMRLPIFSFSLTGLAEKHPPVVPGR